MSAARRPAALRGNPAAGRLWRIEALRGVAALLVVADHVASTSGAYNGHLAPVWFLSGIGVPILFAISGFVLWAAIARSIRSTEHTGRALGLFLVRRLLRIVPLYWVALTALAVFPGLAGLGDLPSDLRFYGFAQIYHSDTVFAGIGPAWTLCVDVTFYAFLILLAATIGRRTGWRSPWLWGAVTAGLWVLTLAAPHFVGGHEYWLLAHTLAGTLDWFTVGILMAVLLERGGLDGPRAQRLLRWRVCLPLAAGVLALHVGLTHIRDKPWAIVASPDELDHLLQALTATFILLPAARSRDRVPTGWLRRGGVALGTISYGIYLWHRPLVQWLHDTATKHDLPFANGVPLALVALPLTLLLAVASWFLVETPCINFGRRLTFSAEWSSRPRLPRLRLEPLAVLIALAALALCAAPASVAPGWAIAALAVVSVATVAVHLRGARHSRLIAPLPLFALVFAGVLVIRAITLTAGHPGRYFTVRDGTVQQNLTAALRSDRPEARLAPAVDNRSDRSQRIRVVSTGSVAGTRHWRWQFREPRGTAYVAARFPDPGAAPGAHPLPVVPGEPIGGLAQIRPAWPGGSNGTIELYARFSDARGRPLGDVLLASAPVAPVQPARWTRLAGTTTAPARAASAADLILVRQPPAGAAHHLDVDDVALVPGAHDTGAVIAVDPANPAAEQGTDAVTRSAWLAAAMLLAAIAGYLLLPARRLALPERLRLPSGLDRRGLVAGVSLAGAAGWVWEVAGSGSPLRDIHDLGDLGTGHWLAHLLILLPVGLTTALVSRRLTVPQRLTWLERLAVVLGVALMLADLPAAIAPIPILTAVAVACFYRRSAAAAGLLTGAVALVAVSPLIGAVRAGRALSLSPLATGHYWSSLWSSLTSLLSPFESLMVASQHAAAQPPYQPVVNFLSAMVPPQLWIDRRPPGATHFTQAYLLPGLHPPTSVASLPLPAEAYLIGGAAGIVVIGILLGLLLRLVRELALGTTAFAGRFAAAVLLASLLFLVEGAGLAASLVVVVTATIGGLVLRRPAGTEPTPQTDAHRPSAVVTAAEPEGARR